MDRNNKGRADCHQATPDTAKSSRHSTGLVSRIKELIGTLALWGWLPVGLADWLIHWGEPHDE